jgi:hypothetical protein
LSALSLSDYFFRITDFNRDHFHCEDVQFELKSQLKSLQIKLVIYRDKNEKVIHIATSEPDFTELLLTFLTYPLGSEVKLLKGNIGLGNIGKVSDFT